MGSWTKSIFMLHVLPKLHGKLRKNIQQYGCTTSPKAMPTICKPTSPPGAGTALACLLSCLQSTFVMKGKVTHVKYYSYNCKMKLLRGKKADLAKNNKAISDEGAQ